MKPTLAVACPLPPTRSGIADYFVEQVGLLAGHFDITIAIASDAPDPEVDLATGVDVVRETDVDFGDFDHRLYHPGNNPHHLFVYDLAMKHPGVVVLHDYTQHHLAWHRTIEGGMPPYLRQMEASHGVLGRRIAERRGRGVFTESVEQFLYPANRELLDRSVGVITHSDWVRRRLEAAGLTTPITVMPMHYVPVVEETRSSARARLGIPEDELALCCLGFLTPPKQIEAVIEAVARLDQELPPYRLHLVGEFHDDEYWEKAIAASPAKERIHATGYVSLEDLDLFVSAADIIYNLRYPLAGETSATLLRALGGGRSVIVVGAGPFDDFPDRVVTKVPLGRSLVDEVAKATRILATDPDRRDRIERAAMAYIEREHTPERSLAGYLDALGTEDSSPSGLPIPSVLESASPADLANALDFGLSLEPSECWVRDELPREVLEPLATAIPLAALFDKSVTPVALLLDPTAAMCTVARSNGFHVIGAAPELSVADLRTSGGALAEIGANWVLRRSSTTDLSGLPFETVTVVVASGTLEAVGHDPLGLLIECNRVLLPGGSLVVAVRNAAATAEIKAALAGRALQLDAPLDGGSTDAGRAIGPETLRLALRAAGFEIETLETAASERSSSDEPTEGLITAGGYSIAERGDYVVCRARKVSTIVDRTPPDLYGGDSNLQFSHQDVNRDRPE